MKRWLIADNWTLIFESNIASMKMKHSGNIANIEILGY